MSARKSVSTSRATKPAKKLRTNKTTVKPSKATVAKNGALFETLLSCGQTKKDALAAQDATRTGLREFVRMLVPDEKETVAEKRVRVERIIRSLIGAEVYAHDIAVEAHENARKVTDALRVEA